MTNSIRAILSRHWPVIPLMIVFSIVYGSSLTAYGMFWWDEAEYASIGRALLNGEGFTLSGSPNALRPPVLPLAASAAIFIGGDRFNDTVVKVPICIFAMMAILCMYSFTARAFNRSAGIAAAVFLGIAPFFWLSVPRFLSEIPYMAFFSAAVWFFYLGAYRRQRFFIWSWVVLGLAFLTRYTAVLFLPVLVVFIPVACWLGGPEVRRRLQSHQFFFGPLATVALLTPWLIRQYVAFGDPLVGFKVAANQLQVYMPSASMPWNFYLSNLPWMLSPPILILAIVGAALAIWKRETFTIHSFLTAIVIVGWFSCYRYKEDRHISSVIPFIVVVAAYPIAVAVGRLRNSLRAPLVSALLATMFIWNGRLVLPILEHNKTAGNPDFLDAMQFLRSHANDEAVVLGANFPQIHWYSGLRAIEFPAEAALPGALHSSEWVVITNFEPSQPPYVGRLAERALNAPRQSAAVFSDANFTTIVMRSSFLLNSLGEK